MLVRPEGPDPPAVTWTRKQVVLWMVSAWSAGRRPMFGGAQSTVRSALDWSALYLPITDPMRDIAQTYLQTWIWTQAERDVSFRELCQRRNWSRSTAMRWIRWALDHIVSGLNADAVRRDGRAIASSTTPVHNPKMSVRGR